MWGRCEHLVTTRDSGILQNFSLISATCWEFDAVAFEEKIAVATPSAFYFDMQGGSGICRSPVAL